MPGVLNMPAVSYTGESRNCFHELNELSSLIEYLCVFKTIEEYMSGTWPHEAVEGSKGVAKMFRSFLSMLL